MMLFNQAVAYSVMTGTKKYISIIFAIACTSVCMRTSFSFSTRNKYIIYVLLAIVTATILVFSSEDYPMTLLPIFNDFSAHFIVYYLLILQVIGLFVFLDSSKTSLLPLYGIMVMIFVGSMPANNRQNMTFLICSIGFVISASMFTTLSRVSAKRNANGLGFNFFRTMIFIGLFLLIITITWFSSMLLKDADDLYMKFMEERDVQASTGYTDRAKLGSIVHKKSQMENEVMLRVFTNRNQQYFRANAYNVYNSSTWKVKASTTTILPETDVAKNIPSIEKDPNLFIIKEPETAEFVKNQVWASHPSNEVMFAPLNSKMISASFMKLEVDENDIIRSKGLHEKRTYTAYSNLENQPITEPKLNLESLTQIPNVLDAGVISLSNRLFKGCNDTGSKIEAVKGYFYSKYEYKLGIEIPRQRDPLSYFLLEKPPAHCEYFATGAAILLRLAGVPCRYVSGYVVTEWNPLGEYWIARNRDAHAWVEAFDEKLGWVIVEATPPAGVPVSLSQGRIAYVLDYIKHYYEVIRTNLTINSLKKFVLKAMSLFTELSHVLYFALIIGLPVMLWILFRRYFWKGFRKRKKQTFPDQNPFIDSLNKLLKKMDQRLGAYGLVRKPYETINQFADRIATEKNSNDLFCRSSRWYKDYAFVRYGENVNINDIESLKTQMP